MLSYSKLNLICLLQYKLWIRQYAFIHELYHQLLWFSVMYEWFADTNVINCKIWKLWKKSFGY